MTSLLVATLLLPTARTLSVRTLLPEMTDLGLLASRPSPFYLSAQSSSYDRNAFKGDPFANGDAGQFDRIEDKAGRKEYVMADLKGPGVVTRVWSANPIGTVRFYFDGEEKPRIEAKLADLLTGKFPGLPEPFSYMAAMGTNLYFPLPYAKSLKVTADDSDGDKVRGLYYHVGYRTYAPSVPVQTFSLDDIQTNAALIKKVAVALEPKASQAADQKTRTVAPGGKLHYSQHALVSSAVTELRVKIPFPLVQTIKEMDWADPHQSHNILRSLILSMKFNGEETVRAPLGDFFGTVPGVNAYATLPFEVKADGEMICRLVMPFKFDLSIDIENVGPVEVPLAMTVQTKPFKWDNDTYTLHAQWMPEKSRTRPMRDLHFLDVKGEGRLLGSVLHISNPTPAWWGEGDEKFYVDGEERPSTFGTGTEDYYGYAWSAPIPFARPYHAQPHVDGPGNFGHSTVERWHIFDSQPFNRSFKFDMEMWHWQDVVANYTRTTYWYAKPGTTLPATIDTTKLLPELIEMPHEPGAIEGETIKYSQTGGTVERQGGFGDLSGGEQLWWKDVPTGATLTIDVPVKEEGDYDLSAKMCHARDYGIHKLSINGQDLGQYDFFGDGVTFKMVSLGKVHLTAGTAKLVVTCVGKNPEALPAQMFGLDYLKLDPVK